MILLRIEVLREGGGKTYVSILCSASIHLTSCVLPTTRNFLFASAYAVDVVCEQISWLHVLHTAFWTRFEVDGGAVGGCLGAESEH